MLPLKGFFPGENFKKVPSFIVFFPYFEIREKGEAVNPLNWLGAQ